MRHRRPHKRPDHRREGSPFFAPPGRQKVAPTTSAFFPTSAQEEVSTATKEEREEPSQTTEDRERSGQSEREEDLVARETERFEDESATQDGEREEEASAQQGEREEEATAQDTEREDAASQEDQREDGAPAQNVATVNSPRQPVATGTAPAIQRTIGDGHDLTAPRFAGDLHLEAAFDNQRMVKRGDSGPHVTRLQQALVELGHQLPGVGVDGIFGSETDAAVRAFQTANGLTVDGIVGPQTMGHLDQTLFVPSLPFAMDLRTDIRQLIAGGAGYPQLRTRVQNAGLMERIFALIDQAFLREIQTALSWNDFARVVELLGRTAPTGAELLADPAVQAGLTDAWNDSNGAVTSWAIERPAHPSHGLCSPSQTALPSAAVAGTHEEGGWIYLNIVTGGIYTRRAAPGGQAMLPLNNPPAIMDSIVVGAFHTHPNFGACWNPAPSGPDGVFAQFVGTPLLVRSRVGAADQDFVTPPPGAQRRAHLAGPQGFPGAGGAIAPQAPVRRVGAAV